MPTYISNSNDPRSAKGITFLPGKPVELTQYLNLKDYPFLVKQSELPLIKSQPDLIFTNISSITDMSEIYTLDNIKTIEVKDGDQPNNDDEIIEIRIFMGHTDDQSEFIPFLDLFKFIRITQNDKNSTPYPYWYAVKEEINRNYEENLIPAPHWPVVYPFFSIAVVSTNISGSVNIYLRDVRQVTNHMC